MKKICFICLLLCIFLLAGCHEDLALMDPVTEPSNTEESAATYTPILSEVDKLRNTNNSYVGLVPTATPDHPEDLAIVYCNTCDYDWYWGYFYSQVTFFILSREPIDTHTIAAVPLGVENFTLEISDYENALDWYDLNYARYSGYTEYIYQTRKGIDWSKAFSLIEWSTSEDGGSSEVYIQFPEEYNSYMNQYKEGYDESVQALTEEADYHAYLVYLHIPDVPEYTVLNQVKVSVQGTEYLLDIGEIRIHPKEELPEVLQLHGDRTETQMSGGMFEARAWSDGVVTHYLFWNVDRNIVLKRVYLLGAENAVIDNCSLILTTADGYSMDSIWDANSDYYLNEGDTLELQMKYYLPELDGAAVYRDIFFLIVEYLDGSEVKTQAVPIDIQAGMYHVYDLCTEWLDGYSLKEYYREYMNPLSALRE